MSRSCPLEGRQFRSYDPKLQPYRQLAMIDPFSLATGIAGVLSLSIENTRITKEYLGSVKSAPKEVQDLLLKSSALGDVLEQPVEFLRSDAAQQIAFQLDSGLHLVLKNCERRLEKSLQEAKRTLCIR